MPTVQYFYDALGQLIRVNDKSDLRANPLGTTWIYEYDLGGNLTQKRMYRYEPDGEAPVNLVESVAYAYDANWRDKLISYDGKPIAYDEIGNPIQYNGTTYEWKAGRQLARMRMRTEVGSNGIEAEDGVDAKSGTRLHIEFTDGNMICGGVTETRAIARVVQDGREISDEYSEKVFHWTRESGDAQADAAWNVAHSGMREITLTAEDVPNKVILRCSITGTADAYGAMVADATNLGLTHQKGDLDAGHTFGVENGNLMLYIPYVEPEALPSDPEIDATEEIPALEMDNGELTEPNTEAGGTPEVDVPEAEDTGDVGSGEYIPGEEEAPDYNDPVNDMPDPVYTPESAIPDEDTAKIPKGISYLLEDGELKIVLGLGDVLTAWATVYNTEPNQQLDFKYNANGLRVQKVYTTSTATETTDYILHGKLITHLTKKRVPSSGTATTEQLHFFYDKNSRPAIVEYNDIIYTYRHNLQGDIVEIVDGNGNVVVNYTYDAWGAPISIEGTLKTTLGELNPFRYRGYVWDEETKLYYLYSRYYAPGIKRFVNADNIIAKYKSLFSGNMFSYCKNNPTMHIDASGKSSEWLFALKYPLIASHIGRYVEGKRCTNITTTAIRFAVNLKLEQPKSENNEGTQVNALRHALWTGIISRFYGETIAREAVRSHEDTRMLELGDSLSGKSVTEISEMTFSSHLEADSMCDMLNNEIALQMSWDNETPHEICSAVLGAYHNEGLWVIDRNRRSGGFGIYKERLSDAAYKTAMLELTCLDDYGFSIE